MAKNKYVRTVTVKDGPLKGKRFSVHERDEALDVDAAALGGRYKVDGDTATFVKAKAPAGGADQ